KGEGVTRQPEQIRAFRDAWKLGIHSYLAYLRDRLYVAAALLGDSGCLFVQIGDQNVHLVRCLLDEVFGVGNFISLITFSKTSGTTGKYLPGSTDYLLLYAKDFDQFEHKYKNIYRLKAAGAEGSEAYMMLELPDGSRRR